MGGLLTPSTLKPIRDDNLRQSANHSDYQWATATRLISLPREVHPSWEVFPEVRHFSLVLTRPEMRTCKIRCIDASRRAVFVWKFHAENSSVRENLHAMRAWR